MQAAAILAVLLGSAIGGGDGAAGESGNPKGAPIAAAVADGVRLLLGMQEGPERAEWPYEGVYRVGGAIPIGYRVGGTGIAAMTLAHAPGYADHEEARAAVERAVRFLIAATEHPLMDPDYDGGYDVRGWGHCYALTCIVRLERLELLPPGIEEDARAAARFYVDALHRIELPGSGGWTYSRARGKDAPSAPSPFMTAPCLQALFEARAQGYEVDDALIGRGLDALERGRLEGGSVAYAVRQRPARDGVPGAVGRMLATETTLALAGRAPSERVRGALDAFLAHWSWLDARRAQPGTHVPPYGVAPYYFYFAHYYAALAIELLPAHEREEYRRRLGELLFSVRLEDGTWNDRVFPRSASYGTAMSLLALIAPDLPPPARWTGAPSDLSDGE